MMSPPPTLTRWASSNGGKMGGNIGGSWAHPPLDKSGIRSQNKQKNGGEGKKCGTVLSRLRNRHRALEPPRATTPRSKSRCRPGVGPQERVFTGTDCTSFVKPWCGWDSRSSPNASHIDYACDPESTPSTKYLRGYHA